jgi:hypothetical protein
MNRPEAARILIVDDDREIHDEYGRILAFSASDAGFTELERKLQEQLEFQQSHGCDQYQGFYLDSLDSP